MNSTFWDVLGIDLTIIGEKVKSGKITPYDDGVMDTYILVLSCMGFENDKINELFLTFGIKYDKKIKFKMEK